MENKIWGNNDLRNLERELENYKLDTPCESSGLVEKYCGLESEHRWYIDKDVCANSPEWIITDIKSFRVLQDKLGQLRKLQAKTEYAKKMSTTTVAALDISL